MDAPANSTPPRGVADTVNAPPYPERNDPPQLPDERLTAIVAQRQINGVGATGSPVRRSPRLSRPSLPPPPVESESTQSLDGNSDDESESVRDVALRPSRDETPENDDIPQDEPSTILASRIMRAHDNPSPPPRDPAHPGIHYMPGKDGQFPLPSVSVPASPFRPINLLERLYQFSRPSFDHPRCPQTPTSGARPDISESEIVLPRGFISTESSSPFIESIPFINTSHQDLASVDTIPSSTTQRTVHDLPSSSSQHSVTITSFLESKALSSLPQVVDSPSNATVPFVPDDYSQSPRSEQQHSISRCSPLPRNARILSPRPANVDGEASTDAETTIPGGRDNDWEVLPADDNGLPFVKREQESRSEPIDTKGVDPSLVQTSVPLSPHSNNVTAACPPPEPALSNKQTNLAAESIHVKQPSVTPLRMPMPAATNPDFSRTPVQRPVIVPTPVQANNTWKLNSPAKCSLELDNIHRTPAQRIPIETTFARGTSSFRKTGQLSAGSDQSRPAPFPNIRAPVFTRPALNDPSRSPAKRIPIVELAMSPTRDRHAQRSPTRLDLRTGSASVESRPFGTIVARSRSVEPCPATSKPDDAKVKEPIFPMVTIQPSVATRLPFPFAPGKKSSSDLPPPIPEEQGSMPPENTDAGATARAIQGNTTSQLRQPSTSSRIPRIGSKPYARPSKTGKVAVNTTTASTIHGRTALPFQLAGKNIGNSNTEGPSSQRTNDQRLVGSLKRKRSTEVTLPPNSHPVMVRQVVPGILSEKYAPKPAKLPFKALAPPVSSPPKAPQPLKFRKVVDGMLSARYAPAKASCTPTELSDTSPPPSPLSDISSSSDEGPFNEKPPPNSHPPVHLKRGTSIPCVEVDAPVVGPSTHEQSLHHDADGASSRPRRTSRTRKPAQQQYVLDIFSSNPPTRPPPARRKPPSRSEGDNFMGMSVTALKALTTSNTTKNQQTVAVLATEVIRKEGQRPESPAVRARTVLQKQRDERDLRRRERAQRRAQMSEEVSRCRKNETEQDHLVSPGPCADHDENDGTLPQKHCQGPGDEEDYETPERPERIVEPLRLEGMDKQAKPVKHVKWHRGLSTAVYLDEVDPKPRSIPMNVVVRGCLAPTSKNLPLDSLGNLVDLDNRPLLEPVTEHIIVKRYLYDNDIEPEPIPVKTTRSKSKKNRS